jgi:hypothetical protein
LGRQPWSKGWEDMRMTGIKMEPQSMRTRDCRGRQGYVEINVKPRHHCKDFNFYLKCKEKQLMFLVLLKMEQ